MNDEENLTQKLKLVTMNNVEISTEEKPIIGTRALVSCVGILIYSEENKIAIVGHSSSNWKIIVDQTRDLIFKNGLQNHTMKYKIIPGAYPTETISYLERAFSAFYPMLTPFNEKEIPDNAFQIVDENGNFNYTEGATLSKRFAFDAANGEFVTHKVFPGPDNIDLYEEKSSGIKL